MYTANFVFCKNIFLDFFVFIEYNLTRVMRFTHSFYHAVSQNELIERGLEYKEKVEV